MISMKYLEMKLSAKSQKKVKLLNTCQKRKFKIPPWRMISPSSLAHPADPEKKWRGGREDRKNEGGREKKRENTRNAFDWSVFSPLNTLFFFFFKTSWRFSHRIPGGATGAQLGALPRIMKD